MSDLDPAALARLRADLAAIPGVVAAFVDDFPARVHLVCDPAVPSPPIDAATRVALAAAGKGLERVEVEVSFRGPSQKRRRVRFVELDMQRNPSGSYATATVTLEWRGETFRGQAEGGGGPLGELRACAQAAIRALEGVMEGAVRFELLAVKPIRIFDRELVAALVRPDVPEVSDLMGIAPGKDECHAMVLAVLNATNRLLGNYLVTGD